MLHPKKGEGEHSKKYNKRRKAPQIALTVLIFSTPLCMAQSALATTSLGLSVQQQSQQQSQKVSPNLANNYQVQNRQTKFASLTPIISEADITALQTTLAQYKTKLAQLSNKDLLDPALKPQLDQAIQTISTQIDSLEAKISKAKADLTTYNKAKQTLSKALTDYQTATDNLRDVDTRFSTATTTLKDKVQATIDAKALADASLTTLSLVKQDTLVKREALSSADASLTIQIEITNNALTTLNNAKLLTAQATEALQTAQQQFEQAQQELTTASNNKAEAQSNYDTANSNLQVSQSELETAQDNLQQAQSNYDTNLIPDPNWTAPTQQVAHTRTVPHTETVYTTTLVPHTTTTLQEQVIQNLLVNSDFSLNSTDAWSGVYLGWQTSRPGMFNGQIVFSYQNQTVSQGLYSGPFENSTLTLSADWFNNDSNRNITDSYSMKIEVQDINRTPVGSATYTSTGRHDWENKSITLTPTGPVSYITVSFSGIDNGYWAGDYGPHLKNPTLKVSYGQYVTETTYEEVITSEEVTTYVEETYYTTEVIQPQQGLTVRVYNNLPVSNPQRSDTAYNLCKTTTLTSINHQWGGGDILGCGSERVMIHYTGYFTPDRDITSLQNSADDGFYMTLDGATVINDWRLKGCGGGWYPVSLKKGQTYAIDAWFYEWGGGACSILNYQSNNGSGVVPEAWYSNGAFAPLIKDPALLPALEEAQANYDLALSNKNSSELALITTSDELNSLTSVYDLALSDNSQKQGLYNSAQEDLLHSQEKHNDAQTSYEEAVSERETREAAKAGAWNNLSNAIEQEGLAETDYNSKTSALTSAQADETIASQNLATEQENLTSAQTAQSVALATKTEAEASLEEATSPLETSIDTDISFTDLETILDTPAPIPPEEKGSEEIPAVIENLMDVDLEAVDPTELTEAQAEQLVEAALVVFETAEQGSAEYEQALDALYLAAEQDDIELPEELAAIPGLAGAVEVLNFLGNAGADMSPKVRAESEKIVVTAVVAAGVAVQAAAGAATSAAVSAGGSTGSSGSRRVGK